jgi:hypothetical protein
MHKESQSLSEKEKAVNFETMLHIMQVQKLLHQTSIELIRRAEAHDATKMHSPELEIFVEYTSKLADCTFGSAEYQRFLQDMKPALEHHYAHNRHHPEHFPNGINDMTLIDVIEMLCDWVAASHRHRDGDAQKSLERSKARFEISDQLYRILENTLEILDG